MVPCGAGQSRLALFSALLTPKLLSTSNISVREQWHGHFGNPIDKIVLELITNNL